LISEPLLFIEKTNMNKKTIKDIELAGKKVIMRVDFNVPLDDDKNITDDTRIAAALPTIQYALEQGASIILMSHLGRPKGEVKPEFSLAPVVAALAEKLGTPVAFASDSAGPDAQAKAAALEAGQVLLLENLRFNPEEEGKGVSEEDQDAFSKALASLGDVYVSDAFGTAHRAHASMAGVTKHVSVAVAGLLLEKELNYLGKALEAPERPFTAIIGGAKVSDKINVISALIEKVDNIIIGGAMAYTFFLANGESVGDSLVEADKTDLANDIVKKAAEKGVNFLLPIDTTIADDFSESANIKIVGRNEIPEGWEGLDIGPESATLFAETVRNSKTVVWNGPMGVFELDAFAKGTNAIANALAETECISIIGGGDSVAAIKKAGLDGKVSHISTGGGASLEFLEGKELPGVVALTDA